MHGHSITPWPLSNYNYVLSTMYFRSRPVFNVTAHLFFQPKEISTDQIDCLSNKDEILPMGTLTVCIAGVETTKSKTGRNLTQNCDSLIAANTTSYQCYLAACIFRFTEI